MSKNSNNMTRLAVLMSCHNRKTKTLNCLNNLYQQTGLNSIFFIDVYLVDDGSTDGTSNTIRENFPDVTIITGNGNLFWNRGMLLTWTEALKQENKRGIYYDFYLWLNDDTFLIPSAVMDLLDCAKRVGEKSIVAGSTCNGDGNITYGGFDANNDKLIVPNGMIQECDYFNGNCILINKSVVESIGILDPYFHHALGDFDYSHRAKQKKIGLYLSRNFVGQCEGHNSLPTWCSPTKSFWERIRALYSSSCEAHPMQLFVFERRHCGLLFALKHFFTIHLRAAIPVLWIK